MDFTLTEEQQLLKQLTERFVADCYPESGRAGRQAGGEGDARANWALMAELGLLGLPIPSECGGLAGGRVETMVLMEALGRGICPAPVLPEIYCAAMLLARVAPGAMAEPIAAIIGGTSHYALAWAEPETRYDIVEPQCRAIGDEAEVRITGTKTFVMAQGDTDGFIVSARDPAGTVRLYLVDAHARGLGRRGYRLIDGSLAEELTLDAAPALLLGDGAAALDALADDVRFAASAEALGIMETLFRLTVEYVKTRQQFGASISSFQAVQHRLSDLYAILELARSLLYRAALAGEAERKLADTALKCYVSRQGVRLAEDCVQLHGGMGVSDELLIGHGLKRLLLLAALFGDADADLLRYARLNRSAPAAA